MKTRDLTSVRPWKTTTSKNSKPQMTEADWKILSKKTMGSLSHFCLKEENKKGIWKPIHSLKISIAMMTNR